MQGSKDLKIYVYVYKESALLMISVSLAIGGASATGNVWGNIQFGGQCQDSLPALAALSHDQYTGINLQDSCQLAQYFCLGQTNDFLVGRLQGRLIQLTIHADKLIDERVLTHHTQYFSENGC